MTLPREGSLLRIFIGESDRHDDRPLCEWLVEAARSHGLAGATVLRGLEGVGARSRPPTPRVEPCPGDSPGTPNLEPVLGRVADDLDFLAFQEMRARSDSGANATNYLHVGEEAVDYARYLKRAFERPILLGYVAVSSHDGWEEPQRDALADLLARRHALREAGVWGVVYFQLFDDPEHEGYFGAAERHFGLLTAKGRKKPAFETFRALTR